MSHPLRVVAHVGDVVEDLLQGPIDLDAFFDAQGRASCAPNTFSAAMMPAHDALLYASTHLSPLFTGVRGRGILRTSALRRSRKVEKFGYEKSPRGNPPLGEDTGPCAA